MRKQNARKRPTAQTSNGSNASHPQPTLRNRQPEADTPTAPSNVYVEKLDRTKLLRFKALTTLSNLKLNALTFFQRTIRWLNVRNMDEQVIARLIRRDKTKTLLIIKKLYNTT